MKKGNKNKKKETICRAASLFPVYYYDTLMKWSDIEYRKNVEGKWEMAQGIFYFNPILKYTQQLYKIISTGEIDISDRKTLCDLHADLSKLEEEFQKKNLAGLNGKLSRLKVTDWYYVNKNGQRIDAVRFVRDALRNADVRSIKFDSEYCRFTIRREEKGRVFHTIYKLSYTDAVKAMMDIPVVPFRFFEKECDYAEDPLKDIRGKGKEAGDEKRQ